MSATKQQIEKAKKKEKFLDYYGKLPVIRLACGKIARNEDTIGIWRKEDSEFSERMAEAEADWALNNIKRVRSAEWKLERVMKHVFAQRSELTGKDGKDLPVPILEINNVPRNNSDKENKTPEQTD